MNKKQIRFNMYYVFYGKLSIGLEKFSSISMKIFIQKKKKG